MKNRLIRLAAALCVMGGQVSFAALVYIEMPTHHLGDVPGNEGTVFQKSFTLNSVSSNSSMEFDFVDPWGPNLERPPQVFLNNQSVGSLGPYFPPLDTGDPDWVTNPDWSHDYNGGFHVSIPVTPLPVSRGILFVRRFLIV